MSWAYEEIRRKTEEKYRKQKTENRRKRLGGWVELTRRSAAPASPRSSPLPSTPSSSPPQPSQCGKLYKCPAVHLVRHRVCLICLVRLVWHVRLVGLVCLVRLVCLVYPVVLCIRLSNPITVHPSVCLTFSKLGPLAKGAKGPGLVSTSPQSKISSKGKATHPIFILRCLHWY